MTAIDGKLAELFRERAAAARPKPDLSAVLEGVEPVRVVAGKTRLRFPRQRMLGIAAAVIVAGAAGVVAVEWHRASEISPGFDRPQITYPDQTPAAPPIEPSSAPSFFALATSPDGTGLVVRGITGAEPLSGAEANTPEASPWKTWPIDGQTVTDIDASPSAFYVATCCAPGGTIWRNGPEETKGTRIDYVFDGVLRATVDPATSTARVGDVVLHEPGVLDVSVLDRHSAVLLVDEPAPHLIVLSTDDFAATAHPDRRTIELPTGSHKPCGIVALEQGILVLSGESIGIDPCTSDRGFIVDTQTGVVITAIRLPAAVRAINSDHLAHVIAVTVNGNVVIGQFGSPPNEPLWSTALEGDCLVAYLRHVT